MFQWKMASLLALGVVLLNGCGKDEDPVKAVGQTIDEPKLMSTWEGPCKLKMFDMSARQVIRFSGASFQEALVGYEDNKCQKASVQLRYEGGLTLKSEPKEGIRHIDLDYKHASLKPLSETGKSLLEKVKACGIEKWEVNKRQDVTQSERGAVCKFRPIPSKDFNTVLVENDHLYFGKSGLIDAAVADKEGDRPKEVDKKQEFQHSKMDLGD